MAIRLIISILALLLVGLSWRGLVEFVSGPAKKPTGVEHDCKERGCQLSSLKNGVN